MVAVVCVAGATSRVARDGALWHAMGIDLAHLLSLRERGRCGFERGCAPCEQEDLGGSR